MNLQSLFQDFNPSKFLVYVSLLLFTILFCLRLDGTISWSYWVVFLPLWIWKSMVIAGACVGSYVWWRHPQYRVEGEGYIHYKAMLISVVLQVLLLMFEVLVCDKLENNRHWWILIFVPLILISIISIVVCIWAVKHDRSFELELFCSVNILQFIFLALRLDEIIMWNWVVVFVPLWIVMCMAVIGVLYAIIFASILLRTPEVSAEQRRTSMHSAVSYSIIVIPLLIYLVLLSNKLDRESSLTYAATCIPLYFTFIVLIFLAFGSKGGNHWWFGIRKDFCQFLLSICPLLQEYGNISYSLHSNEPEDNEPPVQSVTCGKPTYSHSKKKNLTSQSELRVVVPALSIETPD
ncbi:transmembrane protein 185A [Trichonephila inaurata madagascariensis]|uniref:Transmembrane protein 185A n=1 Tax=Trichonephila inaurata madagascariensis TaxID=2747483 RepID=A0A8X6YQ09_9ARAC|nr:transmembrane protein 185A [Trichonephila inaurata madagascariensis]